MADPERRREMGRRARAYVESAHAPAAIDARLGTLLDTLVRAVPARGPRVRRLSAGA